MQGNQTACTAASSLAVMDSKVGEGGGGGWSSALRVRADWIVYEGCHARRGLFVWPLLMKNPSLLFCRAQSGVRGLLVAAALVLGCGLLHADPARWTKQIDAFTAADQANPPAKGGIIFTGSSTIAIWNKNLSKDFPDYNVVGRGFGGSTIEDAVFYADRTVLPHAPRMVVFYAGENDIAGKKTPERVADDFAKFCDIVLKALPETRILYVSMKPSPRRWALQNKMDAANALIAAYCSRTFRTAFLDMKPAMIGPDGQPRSEYFKDDKLHLNDEGYRVWRAAIAPLLAPEVTTVPAPVAGESAATSTTLAVETTTASAVTFTTTADILIDFGDGKKTTPATGGIAWNNIHMGNQNAAAGHALVDVKNAATGITLRVTKPFGGANNAGVASGGRYPASASGDSLFGNTEVFSKKSNIFPEIAFSGLDPAKKYAFTFFASRGGSKDNRTTRYTIAGATESVVELDAANNKDSTVTSTAIAPAADGTLTIAIAPGEANNNANHFTYLGVLEIKIAQ
ncbi:SGNH/GDSL hydrolase family protein [Geminisphaera colitermitum]|uniref:SGNH/GDSL hydrolase family protein n=1 Tax=Geminisphaera colitermitum TaxID=1148786 RepID=UPI0012FEF65A|nr:SGNH/GDSL hydrolase family protein [Geminisphaera colitermitum]